MSNNKKNAAPKLADKKPFIRKEDDLALKQSLIAAPELFIRNKGNDEYLDKLSLKIKLFGGREFTLAEYIAENMVEYRPRFFRDFYFEIARLYGLPKESMMMYRKPECAMLFTIQFIYARFPMNVFNELKRKSKWTDIPGVRENKLFQFLSSIASEQLDLFIDQAYQTMLESKNLLDFQLKYSKQYNVYFQIDLFTDPNATA